MDKIKCEKCGKTTGYARIATKEWVCRSCGHIQKLEEEKTTEENS